MSKKVTHQDLMLAVSQTPKPTPQEDASTSKWVVAAGALGLVGVIALVNFISKKS